MSRPRRRKDAQQRFTLFLNPLYEDNESLTCLIKMRKGLKFHFYSLIQNAGVLYKLLAGKGLSDSYRRESRDEQKEHKYDEGLL
jgi:hypothetical protein